MPNISYKHRFYPNKEQEKLLTNTFGQVRFVWNKVLDWRTRAYYENKEKINYSKTSKKLTELRQEYSFLQETAYVASQQALRNQDKAFSNFFNKRSRYPNFKSKHGHQSFRLTNTGFRFKQGKLYIAKSMDPLKIVWSRVLSSDPSSLVISKDKANRYFVSFCCEKEFETLPLLDTAIGIDMGLTHFLTTSDGVKVNNPRILRKRQNRLKLLQRRLSKKVKRSQNRNKARIKLARVHVKIRDTRNDFLHKLSTKLIRENQTICLEDLNVNGMMKNHKMAYAIGDASWAEFKRQLEYKASWYGRNVVSINRFYPSSKRCSSCGYIASSLPLSIRTWQCKECSTKHDRDVNAAVNIKTAGMVELACGVPSVGDCGVNHG